MLVVVSLNLLDPVLDAMEQPQAQPMARVRREGVQVLNPAPQSLAEITIEYPFLQYRYEQFRQLLTDANLIDRRHAQLALFRDAEKSYESNTGEQRAALAAAPAGALHPQPGADRPRTQRRHLRPHGGGARGGATE